MRYWIGRLATAVFIALTGMAATAQQAPTKALNAYIDGLNRTGAFNGNILISDKGRIVLQRAVGNADASGLVKLNLDDRFQIGSIAKEFDAVGILLLEQEGKLSLSDSLAKFYPELPAWASTITVDNLLHYTSGMQKPDFSRVHSDAENWDAIRAQWELAFPPGTQYSYNNNDVFLRRRIIEKVSGISFADFVSRRELPAADIRDAVIDPSERPRMSQNRLAPMASRTSWKLPFPAGSR